MRRILLFGTELYALPILKPLGAAAAARGMEVRWFLHGVEPRYLEPGEARLDTVAQVRAFRPDAVFAASNWVPDFFPGLKVQVFHGFNVEKRDAQRGHFRVRGLFDLYCTQGPATTDPFRQLAARLRHFEVVETGWPKLDPLFAAADPAAVALRAPAQGRPVILYGSTFTAALSSAEPLYETIAALVARGEWYWLLTLHPKSAPSLFERYRALAGPNALFVESDRLVPLMRAADLLVCDTSSLVSEFVVQRKPVVTFRNRVPQPHMLDVASPSALEPAIRSGLAPTPEHRAALEAYAARIHPSRDGHASERALDAAASLLARGRAGLARKPLNLWRRLQMRSWLGYWRL